MKLASLKNNTRDGQLILVKRDLSQAVKVTEIARTMQQLMDHWQILSPQLQAMSDKLNAGELDDIVSFDIFNFDAKQCHSPLPRAYQWADGSAYVNHVELVRKARNAEIPESFWQDPLMYQGGSDAFIGPYDDIIVESSDFGIDMEAEVAVVVDDTPMATSAEQAKEKIRLFMLVNDVSLRNLIPAELAKGFGFFQSKPSSAFSPVAVTPDELGDRWDGRKLHLPLVTHLNQQLLGKPNCGKDMTFDFPTLVAHAAKTRPLCAGAIIGSGTISNVDRSSGSSCLAEKRMLEIIATGKANTPFMQFGDRVHIEMFNSHGDSIFGAIDQQIVPLRHSEKRL